MLYVPAFPASTPPTSGRLHVCELAPSKAVGARAATAGPGLHHTGSELMRSAAYYGRPYGFFFFFQKMVHIVRPLGFSTPSSHSSTVLGDGTRFLHKGSPCGWRPRFQRSHPQVRHYAFFQFASLYMQSLTPRFFLKLSDWPVLVFDGSGAPVCKGLGTHTHHRHDDNNHTEARLFVHEDGILTFFLGLFRPLCLL